MKPNSVFAFDQKFVTMLAGVALIIGGVVGFFSQEYVFVFQVNTAHNIFHVTVGVLAIVAGFYAGGRYAKYYNTWVGFLFLLLALLGVLYPNIMFDLIAINNADNILHLVLGVGLDFVALQFNG